jgi:gamma-glutamyl-gamma-aminobutyrate hydrolase PuuD
MIMKFFGARAIERIAPAGSHVRVQHELVWRGEPVAGGGPIVTNSFHDFGVRERDVPAALDVLATAGDGWVEAVTHRRLPMVAVMWHPERAGSCAALDAKLAGLWLEWCASATARA